MSTDFIPETEEEAPQPYALFETWLLRVVVLGICWLLGQVGTATAGNAITFVTLPVVLWWPAAALLWGGTIALGQWLMLRPPVASVGKWVTYSVGAFGVGLGLASLLVALVNHPLTWLLGGTLAGAVFGVGQALALNPDRADTRQWAILTTTGWLAAYAFAAIVPQNGEMRGIDILGVAFGGSIGWGVALVLAVIMMVMLYPKEEKLDPNIKWWPKRGVTWREFLGRNDD